jgi:VWFA-related protein
MLLRRCSSLVLSSLLTARLFSQAAPPDSGEANFKSHVDVVVVNVVVTTGSGDPIAGLDRDDFKAFEDGQPQKILSFEEHKEVPPKITRLPQLPPHIFTNFPTTQTSDATDAILLDTLNTPLEDQTRVYLQTVKYLKSMQPGTRVAIFTLGSRLHLLHGFTSDPAVLLSILTDKKKGGTPQPSPILRSSMEDNADQQLVSEMKSMQANDGSQTLKESIAAIQSFQAQAVEFQNSTAIDATLLAFQQLAHYLGGIPGRKNVIWFSNAFPLPLSPTLQAGFPNNYIPLRLEDDLRKTSALLTTAQVAIYPVAAEGLVAPYQDPTAVPIGITNAQQATAAQSATILNESKDRNGRHAAMDEIAMETGGRAFYNTNGLSDVLSEVISHGARYYTLTYTPSNKQMDGRYRHIQIKVRQHGYKLAYRRGYYTDDPNKPPLVVQNDPLKPLMDPGMPNLVQILYNVKVMSAGTPPASQAAVAGNNAALQVPLLRYGIDFAISSNDLNFLVEPDGIRKGDIELALVAYDGDGNVVSRLFKTIEMTLQPKLYAAFQQGGVQVHEDFDVPKTGVSLRTGVYDTRSSKTGTLEIPLSGTLATN